MLYDILSPFIFFLSLGGILLIIGRVVIRVRREQFSTDLSAMNAAHAGDNSLSASFGTREVSNVLRPNQKSVHFIRTRASLLGHVLTQGWRDIRGGLSRVRLRRRSAAPAEPVSESVSASETSEPAVAAEPTPTPAEGLAAPMEQLVTPPASSRFSRVFSGSTRLFRRQSRAEVTSSSDEAPSASADVAPARSSRRWRLRRVEQAPTAATAPNLTPSQATDPAAETSPLAPAEPSAEHVSAATATTNKRRRFSHALRRGHTERIAAPLPAPLAEATVAIAARNFRQAEDVLVPHIVKHPKDTAAYMLLGQAAVGRKAWLEAMEIYEQVVTWNPRYEGAYAALGYAAYRARRFTRALQAFQRAHEAAPTDATILEYLLSIAQKMDNPALQHSITEKLAGLEPAADTKHALKARV